MQLKELKEKKIADLTALATKLGIENASSFRRQDLIFAILQKYAEQNQAIYGDGVLECLPDGFGFLRSPDFNYLPGPDDKLDLPKTVKDTLLY